ncbi:MAG TPA: Yip1 family protein [Gemmatimonadaceae bacterium]|nr:Yip1 family protein [Gemmatimonadaceae bacterium]
MNLVSRVKGILTNPRQEWAVIDAEPLNVGEVLVGYVLPLAAIGPIASIIGWSTFGFGGLFRASIGSLIAMACVTFVLTIVGVFVTSWVINALAPTFGATQSMPQAMKVAIYSSTAAWVAGIFNIFPALAILALIGALYSLYLFFVGLPMLMKAPSDKATTYTVVVIIAVMVIYFIVGSIAGRMVMF